MLCAYSSFRTGNLLAPLVVLVCVHAAFATVQYTVTDLGTLGGASSEALGINNLGQVVGDSYTSSGADHAFLYSNGIMSDLGTLPAPLNVASVATAINDQGQIIGSSSNNNDNNYAQDAFIYSDGSMTDLGTLGGSYSGATGINNSGEVVGISFTSGDMTEEPFTYSSGGGMSVLNLPNSLPSGSVASGINDAGQIVGAELNDDHTVHLFLSMNGTTTDLGNFASSGIYDLGAGGVNNVGQIFGTYPDGSGSRSFLYSNGSLVDLGSIGGFLTNATGINDSGEVVGTSFAALDASGNDRAFLYANGAITDLNTLISPASSWLLEQANAINDLGQIVGVGINPLGQTDAFLLTEVPEPGDLALIAIGLISVLMRRPRHRRNFI
jgi:probable HAF family extracellular repeat protein